MEQAQQNTAQELTAQAIPQQAVDLLIQEHAKHPDTTSSHIFILA